MYCYCANNPINYVDPTRHFSISSALFFGKIIFGALIVGGTAAYSSIKKGDEWYETILKTITGAALLGATNSFVNQIINNDWDITKVNGGRIASDAAVAGIKGLLSFAAGAWTGGAGLWNIPKGVAPGLGNFVVKLYLNTIIGTGLKLTADAIYALILKEECGWINGLESILRRIF